MLIRSIWIVAVLIALPLFATAFGHGKTADKAPAKNPVVVMETSMGTIKVELLVDKAPITTKNILDYVNSGFYNGTIFHRVISNFVIQGGGFLPDMTRKQTRPPITNEASNGLKNVRGSLSMARTSDPNSATSQFFINLKDNASLDAGPGNPGYAVFAQVTEGMDVVDKIAAVKTTTKPPYSDVPIQPVIIKSAKVE